MITGTLMPLNICCCYDVKHAKLVPLLKKKKIHKLMTTNSPVINVTAGGYYGSIMLIKQMRPDPRYLPALLVLLLLP